MENHCATTDRKVWSKKILSISNEAFILLCLINYGKRWFAKLVKTEKMQIGTWTDEDNKTYPCDVLAPGGNGVATQNISPLEFFLLMFPPKQLTDMVRWTNIQLQKSSMKETTPSEVLKFFGILILTTTFEFTTRASLWNTTAWSKYRPAPQFGLTGMSKNRFEDLFSCMRWSFQPAVPTFEGEEESSERFRWKLVDDFVKNFNEHRANYFNPSEMICVDESMSRWYGQGGHWINHGLPQYVAIDRKPENGCEIQNAACGMSGVMLRLKLVKGTDLPGSKKSSLETTMIACFMAQMC
ncbi:Transposase IS4 [Fragilaria crotonensis]|nr:Transposase IS4 [Fragilaria crotonensis]